MSGRLEGKVALITGGASGIGEAEARAFSSEGASVMIADLQTEKAGRLVEELRGTGAEAEQLSLDVRDPDQWSAAIEQCETKFGALHILCNNAGTNVRVGFDDLTYPEYRNILDVNLNGTYLGCRAVRDLMERSGRGAIVNIGSLASFKHGGSTGYTVSKTAILALTKNVAIAYAKRGIRCNVICPGHVDTPFIRGDATHSHNNWNTSVENPANYERRLKATPLGRLQTGADIAKAALFLASDDAEMITGAVLAVDGGASLL